MNELALFAGAGGGILGGKLLGWKTVCGVEINAFCARRLMQRQNEGHLPPFPIWDDVSTFDGRPWCGIVDVVSGGFPCQDISVAGKGNGITGKRSGLWGQMVRIIGEARPSFALVENSPIITIRGHGVILRDLAEMGYDARWGVFSAADAGARHIRERMWILAYRDKEFRSQFPSKSEQINEIRKSHSRVRKYVLYEPSVKGGTLPDSALSAWWKTEPGLARLVHGVADRMDRLGASGNGQVPAVVRLAWNILSR